MARFEITTPVADYNGQSAGVQFAEGRATVTSDTQAGISALRYFREAGYGIRARDELGVDEVLNRANETPEDEATRLRREIAALKDRRSIDELRAERNELYREVYGADDPHVVTAEADAPRQGGEDVIASTLSPGAANYAEGDLPAEVAHGNGGELLAPPAENAPVAEWRTWVVQSRRAEAEAVEKTPRTELIATYGAAYDRDRAAQLTAGAEGGNAPQKGDGAA